MFYNLIICYLQCIFNDYRQHNFIITVYIIPINIVGFCYKITVKVIMNLRNIAVGYRI